MIFFIKSYNRHNIVLRRGNVMTKHEQILKHIESLAIGSKFQLEKSPNI